MYTNYVHFVSGREKNKIFEEEEERTKKHNMTKSPLLKFHFFKRKGKYIWKN